MLAATPADVAARVLIVDGNDRWDGQADENPRGAGHDFVRDIAEVVGNRPIESVANEAVIDGDVDLSDYEAVIWLLGEESTADHTFDADERALVEAYLDGGGNLLVSGAEVAWELDHLGDATTKAFYNGYLHAAYVADSAESMSVWPVAGRQFAGVGELGFYTPSRMVVSYPDVINPVGGAVAELAYTGGVAGNAAISYDGAYKVMVFGFPIESIDAVEQREDVVNRALDFFGL